jgi:hypothetical protein
MVTETSLVPACLNAIGVVAALVTPVHPAAKLTVKVSPAPPVPPFVELRVPLAGDTVRPPFTEA